MAAVLETELGTIVMEFFPDDAPNHVANFVELAESGFYDGTLFHRIIPGFMIQGGDPNTIDGNPDTWGMGGPPHRLDAEFNHIEHDRGIISMARSQDPNSAGSQFFIVHHDSNFLDGQYTAFGRIITASSLETLDMIAGVKTGVQDRPVDIEQVRIKSVTVVERSSIQDLLDPLPPPERTVPPMLVSPTDEQIFDSADLGVSFAAPPGWLVQEPRIPNPDAPDVIAVGPQRDGGIPQIYLSIRDTNQTLGEIVDARTAVLEEILSERDFATLSQEPATVAGLPAHMMDLTELVTVDNRTAEVRFVEVLIHGGDRYYVLAYANIPINFEDDLPHFERVLETFTVKGLTEGERQPPETDDDATTASDGADQVTATPPSSPQPQDSEQPEGGCLIATAAFGSELAPQIQTLRELRDGTVLPTRSGAAFMSGFNTVYYSFSPAVADLEREYPAFREAVRILITPMVSSLSILEAAERGSETDVIVYGSVVIALNIGLYVAAPAAALFVGAKVVMARSLPTAKAPTASS